jgi:hypothetical protein
MDITISIHPLRRLRNILNKYITKFLIKHLGTKYVSYSGKDSYEKRNIWDVVPPTETHTGIVWVLFHRWRYTYEPI